MATACPVCGRGPPRKARVCDACGEPIVRVGGTERTLRALAPSAGLQQGVQASDDSAHTAGQLPDVTTQPRRGRLLIVAAVVIVGLAQRDVCGLAVDTSERARRHFVRAGADIC